LDIHLSAIPIQETLMDPDDIRARALDDLLASEKHLRQQTESSLREMRAVLGELAQRLAGERLEDCRRADPQAPHHWSPQQWRRFFASLPVQPAVQDWGGKALAQELDQLKAYLQRLSEENAKLRKSQVIQTQSGLTGAAERVALEEPVALPAPVAPATLVENASQSVEEPSSFRYAAASHTPRGFDHAGLLRELRSLVIPEALPLRFESRFPKSGLKDADWRRQVRRKLMMLYLFSRGLCVRLEIDHLISQVEGIGSRTGALRRAYDGLAERNLLALEVLAMNAPRTSLALGRLTQDGKELSHVLGWAPAETELDRLHRRHEGERFPQHTLAVLIFAMHARFRSYQAAVLPALTGPTSQSDPDVWIGRQDPAHPEKPESWYVEVELSSKELPEKWQNQVALQGRAAFCAQSAQRRARLVSDCKLKQIRGVATDLEALIAPRVPDITPATPLWLEDW
jgi:hypothetical protein